MWLQPRRRVSPPDQPTFDIIGRSRSRAATGFFHETTPGWIQVNLVGRCAGRPVPFSRTMGLFSERLRVQPMLFAVVIERHLAVEPCAVHGIDIRVEEDLVKMPHEDS